MKARTKRLLNMGLILGTLAVVLIMGLSDQDIGSAIEALTRLDLTHIVLCLGCFFGFLLFDALSMLYFLKRQGYRITLAYALYVSISGQYYSSITPGATGGQPMQVVALHRRYIPAGVATSALVTRFFSFQLMLAILGTVFWIGNAAFVDRMVGGSKWILIVGYLYNLVIVSAVVLLALFRPAVRYIANLLIRIGTRLRLIQKPEETRNKWLGAVDKFHDSIQALLRHPADLAIQLLMGGLQLLCLMSIIWFVYDGLHLTGANWSQLVTMYIMEYLSAAYTPLPGASGAQEAVFSIYFGQLFPGATMLAGLLLWRFFTYYIAMVVGGVVVTAVGLHSGKTLREVAEMADHATDPDAVETKEVSHETAAGGLSVSVSDDERGSGGGDHHPGDQRGAAGDPAE